MSSVSMPLSPISPASSSANFPSTLGGWEGHYLLGWQMTFENVESTSDEYNFLKNYGSYDSAIVMSSLYSDKSKTTSTSSTVKLAQIS